MRFLPVSSKTSVDDLLIIHHQTSCILQAVMGADYALVDRLVLTKQLSARLDRIEKILNKKKVTLAG